MLAQNHAQSYKHAIESLSRSPLPEHNALAISLQRSQMQMSQARNSQSLLQQQMALNRESAQNNSSSENFTQLNEMAGSPVKLAAAGGQGLDSTSAMQTLQTTNSRQKYLVYLGDSRGQVHMISLYLS